MSKRYINLDGNPQLTDVYVPSGIALWKYEYKKLKDAYAVAERLEQWGQADHIGDRLADFECYKPLNIIKSVKIKMRVHGKIVRWKNDNYEFLCTWDKNLGKYMCQDMHDVNYYSKIIGLWNKPHKFILN